MIKLKELEVDNENLPYGDSMIVMNLKKIIKNIF